MQEITIEFVLGNALKRLKRMDSYESYLEYIKSEWYSSVSDLVLALEDKNAWTDLKLPGRLKLEIKSELLGIQANKDVHVKKQVQIGEDVEVREQLKEQKEQWVRYFSKPDNAFFYCNSETLVSKWEIPEGNVEIHDDVSTENSPANSEKTEEMNSKFSSSKTDYSSSEHGIGFVRKVLNFEETPLDALIQLCGGKESAMASLVNPKSPLKINNAYAIPENVSIARAASLDTNDHTPEEGSVNSDNDDELDDGPDPLMAKRLMDMGFSHAAVNAALLRSDNNISAAASILLLAKRNEDTESVSRIVPKVRNTASSVIKKSFNRLRVFPPPSAPPQPYNPPPNYSL